MKKILVIGIILLFISISFAPCINQSTVKASTDDDLVEVTTQACGIPGYGNTTVKLTKEQYQNLEQYLVEFRARLNQTTTREDSISIYIEAVAELDKYGLLPPGMSVHRAARLLTKVNDQRLKNIDSLELDPDANYLCLVSGVTTGTLSFGPFAIFADPVFYLVMYLADLLSVLFDKFYNNDQQIPALLVSWLSMSMLPILLWSMTRGIITTFLPFGLLSTLTFGVTGYIVLDGPFSESSSGWVNSVGINGQKKYEGSELWGTATKIPINVLFFNEHFPGILGFTGLKVNLKSNTFFLGTALKVKITPQLTG